MNSGEVLVSMPGQVLTEILAERSKNLGAFRFYTFLNEHLSETVFLTYEGLCGRAPIFAFNLCSFARPGDRALFVYSSNFEFIVGFSGCLGAGVAAYPPRQYRLGRRFAIAEDARPALALTTKEHLPNFKKSARSS